MPRAQVVLFEKSWSKFAIPSPELGCLSETGNVHFVDHCARERPPQRFIAFPIVPPYVRNHALHGCGTVISGPARSDPAVIRWARNRTAIGIEQYLSRIESQPLFRSERPIDS